VADYRDIRGIMCLFKFLRWIKKMPFKYTNADTILYPWRDFSGGMFSRSDESERPVNSLSPDSQNIVWKEDCWKRKGGRSLYNATYINATQEVRGIDSFNDGTINAILATCNSAFYKTTGDGLMGNALTEPDGTAVAIASGDNDIEGVQIRNRVYAFNGDTADEPWAFDGTNIINYSRDATNGTADGAGTTSTIVDADFGGSPGNDDYNGQYIEITDATDGTKYRGYVTDFVAAAPRTFTFSPLRDTATASGDTFTVGVAGQEERNGKYPITFKNRIFVAVGTLGYWTEAYYPDVWSCIATGVPNVEKIGWQDGENITAMASLDDYWIVFKPHNIYAIRVIGDWPWVITKVTGTNSNKGCVWHRTLHRGMGGLIYMSWDGIYVLDRGLNVHCVSRNIEPTIQALVQSISNPGGINVVTKIDTLKADFDAGTKTNIDTATVSGTFRVALTTEAVDQSQTSHPFGTLSYQQACAQSFKPSIDCICTKIEIEIVRKGSPGNFTVYLKADNNNSPGDTLASATILETDVGIYTETYWTNAFEVANIDDTVLIANTRYWIYFPQIGDESNFYWWGYNNAGGYANGNLWGSVYGHYTSYDTSFKVYEQHYQSSSNLISQIHDLGATPTAWAKFEATETLNGCTIAWTVRSDDASDMSSPTAWTAVENGGIPSITLQRYVQYKATNMPTNVATPVVNDVTIRAYTGTATNSPCAIIWDKGYLLCVRDIGSSVNNVAYRLDEDAWMREGRELWSPKLTGIYANKFFIFNDQLMSCSVGGTGLGGFLYYEDSGTKDLGTDFTATLVTKKHDFSDLDPTFRDRDKIYRKSYCKYKSQVAASLYYKLDAGSWSSAITLSAQANGGIEEDWLACGSRGKCLTLKVEQTVADNSFEWHSCDLKMSVLRIR
jgi:hypothetical protein